jgi:hypothetical protein
LAEQTEDAEQAKSAGIMFKAGPQVLQPVTAQPGGGQTVEQQPQAA